MTSPAKSSARLAPRFAALALTVVAVLTLGPGQALAKKPNQNVVCGQVITHNTHVKNDLTDCPGDGLVIGASNIKLNLGGHTIDGVNNSAADGINNKGGFDNVKIVHGTLQQFGNGVELLGADNNKLSHLKVTQNHDGIRLSGSNSNKLDHDAAFSNFDGIFLVNSDHNRVSHDKAYSNGSSGIVLQFGNDFNKVDHNVAHDNTAWGITSDGSTHDVYNHNRVFNNHTAGIEPFNGSMLTITGNKASRNRIGIELFNSDNSKLKNNRLKANTLDGIHTFTGSTGNLLLRNLSNKNGADGIDVADSGNTLTKNHADKNVNLGIFAAPGTVDGGGNKAHHNGNPLQCVGVVCH
jgi:parallel beta-helix repeat protein